MDVIQQKGKAHIEYIRHKALQIYHKHYKSQKLYWIDALHEAMRDHRVYLILKTRETKPDFSRGSWWKDNGVWKPML